MATPQPTDADAAMESGTGNELQPGMLVVDRDQPPEEQNEAVVMGCPPIPAEQWEVVDLDCTLAAANPDYPADAQTVIVIFRSRFDGDNEEYRVDVPTDVREKLANREEIAIGTLADLCKFYAFPEPRLEPTGEYWPLSAASPPGSSGEENDAAAPADEATNGKLAQQEPGTDTDLDTDAANTEEAEEESESPESAVDLTRLAAVMHEAGFDDVEQHDTYVTATKLGETYHVDHSGEVLAGGALVDKLASFVQERYVDGDGDA